MTLGKLIFANTIIIIVFMAINSFVCQDGLMGGDCVKHLDNRIFIFQMIANSLFAAYYLVKINRRKWIVLVLNLLITTAIYIVAATLHSISKAGLF